MDFEALKERFSTIDTDVLALALKWETGWPLFMIEDERFPGDPAYAVHHFAMPADGVVFDAHGETTIEAILEDRSPARRPLESDSVKPIPSDWIKERMRQVGTDAIDVALDYIDFFGGRFDYDANARAAPATSH